MNQLISTPFLTALGRTSLQAGVLILIVLLAQRLFRRQLSPQWRCALWLLVAVRLILPFSFTSSASIFNLLPGWNARTLNPPSVAGTTSSRPVIQTELATEEFADQPEVGQGISPAQPMDGIVTGTATHSLVAGGAPAATAISWLTVAGMIWLVGVIALLTRVLVSSIRLARRCAKLPPVTDPAVLGVLAECRRQLDVRTNLVVVETSEMSSPALQGLFRPRLLLPHDFARTFSPRELRYIFLHELAHVKRRDLWLNWLVALLQIAHWFNPLVWTGFARWRNDRELACDALAIETAGAGENREYGRTMLRLLESCLPRAATPGLVGIFEDKEQLQQRIQMIAGFRPASRWSTFALLLIAVISVACLTDAKTSHASDSSDGSSIQSATPIQVADPSALPLDLAPVYHESFFEHGQTNVESGGIAGHRVFDGVPFNVNGRVVLYGRNYANRWQVICPTNVNVVVGRKFEELHVLHATYFWDVDGQEIAYFQLNYADGTSAKLPVLYGAQVRDYQRLRTEENEALSDPGSKIIWRGPGIAQLLATQRLFKSTFVNPHPDRLVVSLDLVSTRHLASFFVAAATVVNHDSSRPVSPAIPTGEPERHFDGTVTIRVLDDATSQPLPRALVQSTIDVDGAPGLGAPLYTSAKGEAVIRYPTGRETNIDVVVQMPGHNGQQARWTVNFPDTTTFRLTRVTTNASTPKMAGKLWGTGSINAYEGFNSDPMSTPTNPPSVNTDEVKSSPAPADSTQILKSNSEPAPHNDSLIAYEGFDANTTRVTEFISTNGASGGTGWAYNWSTNKAKAASGKK